MPILCDEFGLDTIDARDWRLDSSTGFLIARPRVARTGIQKYMGSEVDPEGEHFKAHDVIKVYRPPEEVFSEDAMASFPFKPITNDHPKKFVDAKTWKETAVGNHGAEVQRDDDGTVSYVRVPIMVCDGKAVNDLKSGKRQFSVGYGCKIDFTSGTIPGTNEQYDCVQRNIRVNHTAIVDVARGGPALSLDSDVDDNEDNEGDATMVDAVQRAPSLLAMVIDGLNVQVADIQTQSIVQKALADRDANIGKLTQQIADLNAKVVQGEAALTKATSDHKTALDAEKAKVGALEQKVKDSEVTPAKLEQMAKDQGRVIALGKKLLGGALVSDGKSIAEIQKQVVLAKMGDRAKDYDDKMIGIAFDTLTADIKIDASAVVDQSAGFQMPGYPSYPNGNGNNVFDAARAFSQQPQGAVRANDAAYEELKWVTSNKWRGDKWVADNNPWKQKAAS